MEGKTGIVQVDLTMATSKVLDDASEVTRKSKRDDFFRISMVGSAPFCSGGCPVVCSVAEGGW